MSIQISASLLSADFSQLKQEINKVENSGIEMLHYDVMDGVFVPNISFGIPVLKSIRKCSDIIYDVHLMINKPDKYIKNFSDSGADIITFHYESDSDVNETIDLINFCGKKAGLSVKPGTDIETVYPYLDKLYLVLVMTVEPGFGGQGFIESSIDKIIKLKKEIDKRNLNVHIEVDGGINALTSEKAVKAGADILVAGSYLFSADDMKKAADLMR